MTNDTSQREACPRCGATPPLKDNVLCANCFIDVEKDWLESKRPEWAKPGASEPLETMLPREDHACSTGDCGHDKQKDCDDTLARDYATPDAAEPSAANSWLEIAGNGDEARVAALEKYLKGDVDDINETSRDFTAGWDACSSALEAARRERDEWKRKADARWENLHARENQINELKSELSEHRELAHVQAELLKKTMNERDESLRAARAMISSNHGLTKGLDQLQRELEEAKREFADWQDVHGNAEAALTAANERIAVLEDKQLTCRTQHVQEKELNAALAREKLLSDLLNKERTKNARLVPLSTAEHFTALAKAGLDIDLAKILEQRTVERDAALTEVKRLGKEVEELMQVDYWQDRHDIVKRQNESLEREVAALWSIVEQIHISAAPNARGNSPRNLASVILGIYFDNIEALNRMAAERKARNSGNGR